MSESKNTPPKELDVKLIAIKRLLVLIEGANKEIELSQKIKANLMVRQALHLKKQYTKELLGLLKEYHLPIQLLEAA